MYGVTAAARRVGWPNHHPAPGNGELLKDFPSPHKANDMKNASSMSTA
jgi:hypothetical protein